MHKKITYVLTEDEIIKLIMAKYGWENKAIGYEWVIKDCRGINLTLEKLNIILKDESAPHANREKP